MRLVRLVVTTFKGIKQASLDFGAGLNVLYGPNDLGKSTLAHAIHAALLVPAKGKHPYDSWRAQEDERPSVALTFEQDARFWRVEKTFSEDSPARASLASSKDGRDWSNEASGREVDAKLRTLLQWGVPAPGGGGARLPESFLINALLAPQDGVDDILASSLTADKDPSGKLRLTNALSVLAQDPLLKKLLDAAQDELKRAFTNGGKRKSGAQSPFTPVADELAAIRTERAQLAAALEGSAAIEQQANALRERRAQAALLVEEATAALGKTREAFEQGRARAQVRSQLDAAQGARNRVTQLEAEQAAVEARRVVAAAQVARLEAASGAPRQLTTAAQAAFEQANEALRDAQGASGVQARELKRAQLAEQLATAATAIERLRALRGRVSGALDAGKAASTARADLQQLDAKLGTLKQALAAATAALETRRGDEVLANSLNAFARWTDARQKQQAALGFRAEGKALRDAAFSREAEATKKELQAQALLAARHALPAQAQRVQLRELDSRLQLARAELKGAFKVTVRPRNAVTLTATVDEKAAVEEAKLLAERVYEAERRVLLSVGNLVDIEVTGGTAEKRAELETLQRRWASEAAPLLQPLGISSLAELDHLVAEDGKHELAARALRDEAATLRHENESALLRVNFLEQQAATAPTADQVTQHEAAIGDAPRDRLQHFLTSLGAAWDEGVNKLTSDARTAVTTAQAAFTESTKRHDEALWQRTDVERRRVEAEALHVSLTAELGAVAPGLAAVDKDLAVATAAHAEATRALEALGAEADTAVEQAKARVTAAKGALEQAQVSLQQAQQGVSAAQGEVQARLGELAALGRQLEQLDVPALDAQLAQAQAAFDQVKHLPAVTAEDVAAAETTLNQRRDEHELVSRDFHTLDGQLSTIAGPTAKDRVRDLDAALLAAEARQAHLWVEADAWKLLHETLRQAENEQGAHLGRALATGVTARFGELTQGRYGAVSLQPTLATQGVALPGVSAPVADVLEGLSVGTRDQLATLIRLAIAHQLATTIVLDDQLVHTDVRRLGWFADVMRKTALTAQVLVFTCREHDYLSPAERPDATPTKDSPGVRALDTGRLITTW